MQNLATCTTAEPDESPALGGSGEPESKWIVPATLKYIGTLSHGKTALHLFIELDHNEPSFGATFTVPEEGISPEIIIATRERQAATFARYRSSEGPNRSVIAGDLDPT